MGFQSIIVPVFGAVDDSAPLDAAFAAARPFGGHVSALFIHPDPRTAVPFLGVPVTPEVVQEIIDGAEEIARERAGTARASVQEAAKRADAAFGEAPMPGAHLSCSFRVVYGQLPGILLAESHLADLMVVSAGFREDAPDLQDAFIGLLLKSQRPVLVAPHKPISDLIAHIAIGWDGGAAASHALHAALPLLNKAARVTLYSVKTSRHVSLAQPHEYLALHGIDAQLREVEPRGDSAGNALLDAATGDGASLLVAGGYGHSRIAETFFGGATVDLTAQTELPLLLVH